MIRGFGLAVVALTIVIASSGCGPTTSGSGAAAGEQLVRSKCALCHDLARVESADFGRARWEETVGRMEALGLIVSGDEKQEIIDYLTERDAAD